MRMEYSLPGTISNGGIGFLRLQDGRIAAVLHRHVPGLHGGGMPAPIRSLIEHFPDELGLRGGEQPTAEPEDPYSRRPEERRDDDPGDR